MKNSESDIIADAYAEAIAREFANLIEGVAVEQPGLEGCEPGISLQRFRKGVALARKCRDAAIDCLKE